MFVSLQAKHATPAPGKVILTLRQIQKLCQDCPLFTNFKHVREWNKIALEFVYTIRIVPNKGEIGSRSFHRSKACNRFIGIGDSVRV